VDKRDARRYGVKPFDGSGVITLIYSLRLGVQVCGIMDVEAWVLVLGSRGYEAFTQ